MKKTLAPLLLIGLLLAGCSSPAEQPEAPSAPPSNTSSQEAAAVDRTADVQKVAGKHVTGAEESEPGRIMVETDLADPGGEGGSPEAKQAISICEAVSQMDGVSYVSVMEEDGTSWVLFGHPALPKGECGEI